MKALLITSVFCLAVIVNVSGQATPQEMLNKAIYEEEVNGNLEEAMKLYLEIADKNSTDRAITAEAYYHLGLTNEKLGNKKAKEYYEKVVNNFEDQPEFVRIANERLKQLILIAEKVSNAPLVMTNKKIWEDTDTGLEGATSPDGKYLSYVDEGDLAIYEIATGKKRRLTNKGSRDESDENALMSRWSPDSKQIVYEWYNGNDYCDIRIIGLDGSKPRILYSNKEVDFTHPYDWSPDGEQILAYFENEDGTDWIVQIVLVSIADGSVRVLKTFDGDWPENMCFSPDGRFIVYDFPTEEDAPERDIFLLSIDGSREIPLVENPYHDELLGWAPDGKNIIFASDRNGTFSLWSQQIAEGKPQGNPELLKSNMGSIQPLGFTRGGSFYYGYSQKNNNIYDAELDPETGKILTLPKRTITRFEGYNQAPCYSPDGKYLAFISRRFPLTIFPDYTFAKIGGNVLCIKSLETGKEREISPDFKFRSPYWSSDGRSVFVIDMNNGRSKQIDIQTGNVTQVLHDDNIGPQPTERSNDGKTIYYVFDDTKAKIHKIVVRNLESGSEKEIYRSDGGLHIRLSPDGKWIAIQDSYMESFLRLTKKTPSLLIIPSAGGEPQELIRFEDGIDILAGAPFTWTPDGKYILYSMKSLKKENEKWDLYRIPANGGTPERLGMEIRGFALNLCVHPDGRHIAFSLTEQSNANIWVMENFLPLEKLPQKNETEDFIIRKVNDGTGVDFAGGNPSPDGSNFAFTDWETGNLAIYKSTTGKKSLLTKDGSWESDHVQYVENSTWSPDGKQIVYDWQNETGSIELRLIGIDGSNSRILYKNEEWIWVQTFDWSADGKQILACFQRKDHTRQIVLVSAENGSVRVLKTLVGKNWMNNMSFSPNGQYIVYDYPPEEYSQDRDIYVISADGGHEISLIKHPANDYVLGWVPDGKDILFASDRTGTFDAYVIQVADGKPLGEPKLIKSDIGNINPKGFTQKGSFYYSTSKGGNNIYTADLDPETGKILAPPRKAIKRFEGSNGFPYYSSDGKYLAYISVRNRQGIICIRNLDTGEDREISLNQFNINRARSFRWSPDCSSILASGRDNKSGYGIFRMNVQTGNVTPIIPWENWKSTFIHSSELSPDGKSVFYVDFNTTDDWSHNNLSQIMVRDLDTGAENELYRFDNYINISLSPDGKWLASSHPSSLKIMPAAGGEVRELYRFEEESKNERQISWSAEGKYILFSRKKSGQDDWELCRIPAGGGAPQTLGLEMENGFKNLSSHPSGQKIAFSTSDQTTAEFWEMKNFLPATK